MPETAEPDDLPFPDHWPPGRPAYVVVVEMRHHHIVDVVEAELFERGDDTARVPPSGIAGIDQDRFAGRCNEQRRLAAFDVNEINLQRFRGISSRYDGGDHREA